MKYLNRTGIAIPIGKIVKIDSDERGVVLSQPADTEALGVVTAVSGKIATIEESGIRGVFIYNKFSRGDTVYLRKANERGRDGDCYASASPTAGSLVIGTVQETGVRRVANVKLNIYYSEIAGAATGYVPYTGAVSDVDLGSYDIEATDGRFDGNVLVRSDSKKVYLGASADMTAWYDGTDGNIKTSDVAASDLKITTGAAKTVELQTVVWDDLRITPGSFDRPGVADPDYVIYYPNGGGLGVYLPEFAINDFASFTIQLPHSYKEGENIYVHLHWTPRDRGVAESGNTVGWKIDYSWADIGGNFPDMQTADLSDACDGTNHKHQMTTEVAITGTGKHISSMIMCNIRRSDTGTDDTWSTNTSGNLPLLLEVDFHVPLNTVGSRTISDK